MAAQEQPWCSALAAGEYNSLSLAERAQVLVFLVQGVLDGPTLRALLDSRMEDLLAQKRTVIEEGKVSVGPARCGGAVQLLLRSIDG